MDPSIEKAKNKKSYKKLEEFEKYLAKKTTPVPKQASGNKENRGPVHSNSDVNLHTSNTNYSSI
jgi:hypothetical protein